MNQRDGKKEKLTNLKEHPPCRIDEAAFLTFESELMIFKMYFYLIQKLLECNLNLKKKQANLIRPNCWIIIDVYLNLLFQSSNHNHFSL